MNSKYITKVRFPASPHNNVETQPVRELENRPLPDIMIDYIQGRYDNLDEAYEAFSDELNRRIYEAIAQYQPPSPPDPLAPLTVDSFQELVDYVGNLSY